MITVRKPCTPNATHTNKTKKIKQGTKNSINQEEHQNYNITVQILPKILFIMLLITNAMKIIPVE